MRVTLESLAPCLQGLIPATLYTCARDGTPNAAYLSHVDYVDASHVALSFQFFNKSRRNIAENPHAYVRVLDPDTGQGWGLRLRYRRSETAGPVFDRMALRIEAIASYSGLKGIFKLLAADIYEVLLVEPLPDEGPHVKASAVGGATTADPVFTIRAMQDLAERIHRADALDQLLDGILAGLEASFGFTRAMLLLPSDDERVLVTIASRGYAQSGVGAEVRVGVGEGIIGMVAEARKPIRISGLLREMLYASAVRERAREEGLCTEDRRIALPGLPNPESQLGIPLLVRGELAGVLLIESETPYRFHEEDKASVELLGSYLAIAIHDMQLQERSDVVESAAVSVAAVPAETTPAAVHSSRLPREVVYYQADECILIDGQYVIRSLPAKILWKLLRAHEADGRVEFTNRELRLDKSLKLPEWRDNLESRLLLLRRRLEQKDHGIRLVPRARGRFALLLSGRVALREEQ
jgi:adenylate cyclase